MTIAEEELGEEFHRRLECLAARRLREFFDEDQLKANPWVCDLLRDVESRRPLHVVWFRNFSILKIERGCAVFKFS